MQHVMDKISELVKYIQTRRVKYLKKIEEAETLRKANGVRLPAYHDKYLHEQAEHAFQLQSDLKHVRKILEKDKFKDFIPNLKLELEALPPVFEKLWAFSDEDQTMINLFFNLKKNEAALYAAHDALNALKVKCLTNENYEKEVKVMMNEEKRNGYERLLEVDKPSVGGRKSRKNTRKKVKSKRCIRKMSSRN